MLRVIFDTNIYGLLALEKYLEVIEKKIEEDKNFVVYGFQPIRKELRDTPTNLKLGKLSKRNLMLGLYDRITHGRYLHDSIAINRLALKYYNAYRTYRGVYNWDIVKIDFTIVACATYYKLDIIYSEDNQTLVSKQALKAYHHINIKENLRTSTFYTYRQLLLKFGITDNN